jgi:lipid A 3-O-deacylase
MSGRSRAGTVGLALVAMALAQQPARAQWLRAVTVAMDNDGWAFWIPRPTDWFYTDGQLVELDADWKVSGLATLGVHGSSCFASPASYPCAVTHVRLSQKIYTPENLFFYRPGVVDRPYAGWLSLTWARDRFTARRTTAVSFEAGVTGGPSLARQVQKGLHTLLNRIPPQGWEYQLPFEVAFAASVRDTWRVAVADNGKGWTLALEPHWALTAGTLRTSAEAGYALRVGWKASPASDIPGTSFDGFHLVARLGADGEAVLRDLFLDGSTWKESASIPKEPLMGRTRASVLLGWRRVDLRLAVTRSTKEFKAQDVPHLYGTLGMTLRR